MSRSMPSGIDCADKAAAAAAAALKFETVLGVALPFHYTTAEPPTTFLRRGVQLGECLFAKLLSVPPLQTPPHPDSSPSCASL